MSPEERSSEAAMSGGKKNKIRKQYSVHCDGKENLRVDNSPQNPRYGKLIPSTLTLKIPFVYHNILSRQLFVLGNILIYPVKFT